MENLGEKIYKLRTEKKVSQEGLAQELNVARFTVSRWETNAAQPTTENLKSLCEFFGVASSYFFDDGEEAAQLKDEAIEQEILTETVKEDKFKTLKIITVVTGMVLLALFIVACGIAAYVTISPGAGGEWSKEIHIVNYEGIILLVVGVVAAVLIATLSILLLLKIKKNAKNRQ